MKAIFLAAGYATRLYPITMNFPKPLLKVGGRTILDRLADDISDVTDEFIVVTNNRFAGFFEAWASGRTEKVTVIDDGTSTNETRLGAVRDMQLALQGNTDDVIVLAGDNVLDFSLHSFIDFFTEKRSSCVMTYEEKDILRQRKTAIITFDGEGLISSYEEKPSVPKGSHAVPPFYCYTAADAGRIAEALADGCSADAPGSFAAWLSQKTSVYAYEMPGVRYDVGDIESYEYVKSVFPL